jgi:hypothetical protein
MRKLLSVGLSALVLALAATVTGVAFQAASPPAAHAQTTTNLTVCGVVSSFAAATAAQTGSLTINGTTYVIAPGASLSGGSTLTPNTYACLNATVNGSGQIVGGSISANTSTAFSVCGFLSAYVPATATAAGSITIGGVTYPIAPGTAVSGASLAVPTSVLCLQGTLNGSGQLSTAALSVNAGTSINICGPVTSYSGATGTVPGAITINGQTFTIAAGAGLTNANLITTGTLICLSGTLNASGQLAGGTVTAAAGSSVFMCGIVTAYQAATGSTTGSLTIGGQTITIAAGTTFTGAQMIVGGANVCINGTLNSSAQLTSGTVTLNPGTAVNVCGVLSAYTPATAGAAGSLTVNGSTYAIAPGTTVSGTLTTGSNICIQATTNAAGQITGGTITTNTSATVNVCGTVSAYTPATAGAVGSLTINGTTYPIAAGVTLTGASVITTGANVCLAGTTNGAGQLTAGTATVPAGVPLSATLYAPGGGFGPRNLATP